jgi:hypothetical protein
MGDLENEPENDNGLSSDTTRDLPRPTQEQLLGLDESIIPVEVDDECSAHIAKEYGADKEQEFSFATQALRKEFQLLAMSMANKKIPKPLLDRMIDDIKGLSDGVRQAHVGLLQNAEHERDIHKLLELLEQAQMFYGSNKRPPPKV